MRIRREAEAGPAQGLEGGFYRCRMLRYNKRRSSGGAGPLVRHDGDGDMLPLRGGRGIRGGVHS